MAQGIIIDGQVTEQWIENTIRDWVRLNPQSFRNVKAAMMAEKAMIMHNNPRAFDPKKNSQMVMFIPMPIRAAIQELDPHFNLLKSGVLKSYFGVPRCKA